MVEITTLEEARKYAYNRWAGNPSGNPYRAGFCVQEVHHGTFHSYNRPNGHGPAGLYCRQHNPEAVKARKQKREEKYDAKEAARRDEWRRRNAVEALCDGVDTDTLEKLGKGWVAAKLKEVERG